MNTMLWLLMLNIIKSSDSFLTTSSESNTVINNDWDSLRDSKLKTVVPLIHSEEKSYYLGIHFKATYFEAAQLCGEINMQLVNVENEKENNLIYKYVRDANKGDKFWTSGTKLLDGKHWVWMTNGVFVDYTNWTPGSPDSQKEHCLALYHKKDVGLSWIDKDCLLKINFICEKRLNGTSIEDSVKAPWNGIYADSVISANVPLFHTMDKSYFLGRYHEATFQEAFQICKMMNMHLVAIITKEENDRIFKYIRDTNAGIAFWTSGTRMIDGLSWVWMSTAHIIDYTNWSQDQPDSTTDNCIELIALKDKGLFWTDTTCFKRLPYICEKPREIDLYKKTYVGTDNIY